VLVKGSGEGTALSSAAFGIAAPGFGVEARRSGKGIATAGSQQQGRTSSGKAH
jgi:hypothetical protein